jgi:hypothetical protein
MSRQTQPVPDQLRIVKLLSRPAVGEMAPARGWFVQPTAPSIEILFPPKEPMTSAIYTASTPVFKQMLAPWRRVLAVLFDACMWPQKLDPHADRCKFAVFTPLIISDARSGGQRG